MRRLFGFLLSMVLAGSVLSMDQPGRVKTWGVERLTSADLNAEFDADDNYIITKWLAGGNIVTFGEGDSIIVKSIARIDTVRSYGTILMKDGTAAALSLAFTTNDSTGLYLSGTDQLAVGADGELLVLFDGVEDEMVLGDNDKLTFGTGRDADFYFDATNFIFELASGFFQFNDAVNIGVDDTGHDLKAFGATAGKSMLWDESADKLIVTGDFSVSGTSTGSFGGQTSWDAIVDAAGGGDYTTLQAADDALDGAEGYTVYVKGGQTYDETLTISTNHNVWFFEPSCILTVGIVSGTGNTLTYGADTQYTGDFTVSGPGNVIEVGPYWNFDGVINITATGDQVKMTLGANGSLASTFTANAAAAACDITIGAVSQLSGNVLVGGLSTIFSIGGQADFDGTVTVSGAGATFDSGEGSDFADTFGITGARAVVTLGARTTVTGIVTQSGTSSQLITGNASVIVAAVNTSGTDSRIFGGSKTDFGGIVTLSAADQSFILENGCDLDGIVVSGPNVLIDGGGHGTLVDGTTANIAISVTGTGDYVTVKNIAVQTTSGGEQTYQALLITTGAHYGTVRNVRFMDADAIALNIVGGASTLGVRVIGCVWAGTTDSYAVEWDGHSGIFALNAMADALNGSVSGGIYLASTGDNSVVIGNTMQDATAGIYIGGNSENVSFGSNAMNAAASDFSGTSTADGTNEIY